MAQQKIEKAQVGQMKFSLRFIRHMSGENFPVELDMVVRNYGIFIGMKIKGEPVKVGCTGFWTWGEAIDYALLQAEEWVMNY